MNGATYKFIATVRMTFRMNETEIMRPVNGAVAGMSTNVVGGGQAK